jgi:hypothetical protein
MLSFEEINVIGQITNSTWGNWSTKRNPGISIKCSLSSAVPDEGPDILTLQYTTVVNLTSDSQRSMRDAVAIYEDESIRASNDYLKDMKKDFKEAMGRSLKLKEIDTYDSVELITMSPYSPKRTAYYRRYTKLQCE